MSISLSDLQHVTLESYPLDKIESSIPSTFKLMQYFKKTVAELDVKGRTRTAYIPFQFATNMGVTNSTSAFPAAAKSQYQRQAISADKCIRLATSVAQSTLQSESLIGDIMLQLKTEIVDALPRILNSQFCGDYQGALATYTAGSTASATQTVNETSRLERGMRVLTSDSGSTLDQTADQDLSNGLSGADCYTVGTIDSDTQFTSYNAGNTAEQTDTVSNGRRLWMDGSLTASGNDGFNTLENLVDDGNLVSTSSYGSIGATSATLYGLTRTSYDILNSRVEHNGNTSIAYQEKTLRKLLNKIEKKYPGAVKVLTCNYEVEDAIIETAKSDRIIIADSFTITPMGDEVPAYHYRDRKIPIIVDEKLRKNNLWALDTDKFYMIMGSDDGWEDTDGSIWRLGITSGAYVPEYIAYYAKYIQFACTNIQRQGVYRDIAQV